MSTLSPNFFFGLPLFPVTQGGGRASGTLCMEPLIHPYYDVELHTIALMLLTGLLNHCKSGLRQHRALFSLQFSSL